MTFLVVVVLYQQESWIADYRKWYNVDSAAWHRRAGSALAGYIAIS